MRPRLPGAGSAASAASGVDAADRHASIVCPASRTAQKCSLSCGHIVEPAGFGYVRAVLTRISRSVSHAAIAMIALTRTRSSRESISVRTLLQLRTLRRNRSETRSGPGAISWSGMSVRSG